MNWFHLVQDSDQWRALLNTGMKFQVPLKGAEFVD
jgi:hypothetical protein